MNSAEFDAHADEYYQNHLENISVTGEKPEYFAEYKIAVLKTFVDELNLTSTHVLDFGSGIGNSLPYMHTYLPSSKLTCADVSQRSLDISELRYPNLARHCLIERERIPADDNAFDVTFSACVFHHIPHEEHVHWLAELLRVTRPGGLISVFEHNPRNPLTVRAVNTCPFDANARLIPARQLKDSYAKAGWRNSTVRYHVFFPRLVSRLRVLEPYLTSVALGAQYSLTATKPK